MSGEGSTYQRIIGPDFLKICTARIRRAYEYWDGKRHGRSMPSRADIDPSEIRDLLPGIILIDVARDPLRLTYRLVGTDEVEARGYDPTGKDVKEHVFAVTPEFGFETYSLAVARGVVVYDQEPWASPNPRLCEVGSVVMPLSNDGRTVDMLMAFCDYRRN
ncbi:PAS domain-containing protein [Dongia sp.]|uniref:PAS domain-containing protein n=1 Tax=Dongia sp. TaxID=1977262 RepID=UPI0035B2DDE3